VEWPCEPIDPFFNVNRPEDLAEAERLLAAEPSL
jgi:molybdopterin-guanine dinucleotide biosynthesis protein A